VIEGPNTGLTSAGIANLFIVDATANGTKTRLTSECFYDGAPARSPDVRR
jgi:hypothetical protein